MQGGLLLDVAVGESAAILQLLARKDQTLLFWIKEEYRKDQTLLSCLPAKKIKRGRNTLVVVLDLLLHVVDGVGAGLTKN